MNLGRAAEIPTPSPHSEQQTISTSADWIAIESRLALKIMAASRVSARPIPPETATLSANLAERSFHAPLGEQRSIQNARPSNPMDDSEMMLVCMNMMMAVM